jgi:hypothetical protein
LELKNEEHVTPTIFVIFPEKHIRGFDVDTPAGISHEAHAGDLSR